MSKGSAVKHHIYGTGTVVQVLGMYALVDFDGGVEGTRTVLMSTLGETEGSMPPAQHQAVSLTTTAQ